ncbi:CDP-glycerol glycerophosphotransferase family protein [Salinibacterium soli]|uniref:CDP-glycerol glycerophosphotransferase family protein n=1 Tax=Antiquaquibacter soli TaxID=3064523 RepID=A0ABT9BPP0_9MICO|nr:CDP-glycerol glycerophosphotransferase family protein [Protaetiibacter sp. WY-16]MDO7881380.1 CDP-glycerol glycerophosphotransferase family protein [Protaetiibacter sp. WY-16]
MPLLHDIRTAQRVLRNILRSRATRRRVAVEEPKHPHPDPGTIKIAVYFADAKVNLYQIRQWYAPLAEIAGDWPVAIISRSPSAVLALWEEAPVPALYLRRVTDLEHFVAEQDLRIVFYVNQNARNFQMFRYGRMWHVFINHGESDKMYMTTNQFKAYDYSLVAGDAALDRLSHKLWDFDLAKRAIPIGRPQADHFAGELPFEPDDRTVVLYAPTWEGDRAAAAYGSIATHGVALVDALLATGRHRVIYRPHPRSGVLDPEYRAANERIIASLAAANAADATAHHVFDDGPSLGWQLVAADVAITDISAMVYDRLATGKPLLVTRPSSPLADVDENGYLGACEWLRAEDAGDIVAITDRVQFDEDARARLEYWVERHFGDTSPGAATRRFRAAIEHLLAEWDKHDLLHAGDRRDSEADPFDDEDDEEAPPAE